MKKYPTNKIPRCHYCKDRIPKIGRCTNKKCVGTQNLTTEGLYTILGISNSNVCLWKGRYPE